MYLKTLTISAKRILRTTKFWQENHLIFRELKYFRWVVIAAIFFSIIAALMAGGTIGLIGIFLQVLTNPIDPPLQTGIQWLDAWCLDPNLLPSDRIYRLSLLILFVIWLQAIFFYLGDIYSKLSAIYLTEQLRKRLFEQLQSVGLSFFFGRRPGELINTIRGETNQIQQALNVFSIFITQGSMLIVYLVLMFFLSWQLSVAAIMGFSLLSVAVSSITARVREASFEVPTANKRLTSVALEYINGIRTVHASATHDYERQRFYSASEQVAKATAVMAKLTVLVQPLSRGMSSTLLILMVAVAFNTLVQSGEMKSTTLLTFLLALSRTMPVVTQLNGAVTKINSFQGSFESITQLLSQNDKPYIQDGNIQFSGLRNSIEFISVNFGYSPQEFVLHDITLSIRKGKTTALVGASGSGKTTLVDLIARFFDPVEGNILVDGLDLRSLNLHSLRNRMAIVSQDTFVFNESVKYNIAYGLKTVDSEAIWEAARQANALDFILDLPQGLETRLGDRGVRLSGGQRQRIAIARAILRDPEILILDEATSALDSLTEKLIQESLELLSQGRTVIVIAHRLSTILRADKVVVLEKGRIIEQGSYQELIEKRGKLWRYHQIQYATKKTA